MNMERIRITKEFRFEGAHSLNGYDGKCRHIHGHSYILYVTIIGTQIQDENHPNNGMVMDFTKLKKIVNDNIIDKFDHALVLSEKSPLAKEISVAYENVIITPFQPTSENLISYFAKILSNKLPEGIELFSLKLHETATSYAEWFASDNLISK